MANASAKKPTLPPRRRRGVKSRMIATAESVPPVNQQASLPVLVFGSDGGSLAEVVAQLKSQGWQVHSTRSPAEAIAAARGERPAFIVVIDDPEAVSGFPELGKAMRSMGIPVLSIVDAGIDAGQLLKRQGDADDWVFRAALATELPLRVNRLMHRAESGAIGALPTESRFFPLIVHDLRTPLNVIGLSLRMIEQALPKGNSDVEEDLRFVLEEEFR